ncbi:MAG: DUF418 domain-containing protein [Pseudomonadota bacterium]
MTYLEQSSAAGRHIFPDLARAFALIGIAVVNVGVFAHPFVAGYSAGGMETAADQGAYFAVNALTFMKSYTLFSFMFGVGFAYQLRSAERRGAAFSNLYWRRIAGLFILGAIHGTFFFQGDILAIYAMLGAILFPFRNSDVKSLIRIGIFLYLCQLLVIGAIAGLLALGAAFEPEAMAEDLQLMEDEAATALAVYGSGSFLEVSQLRFREWLDMLVFGNLMQGIGALSFFFFGFAAVCLDTIATPAAPFWRRCRTMFLPIGIFGSILGAYIMNRGDGFMDPPMMFGMFIIVLFSPFSTMGYLGLIAKWAEGPAGRLKVFLARGGTASLTAYLLQSVILSLTFCGYGLGYFGQLGAATCIIIGLGVGLVSLVFTSLWRKRFARGPMELLLRRWTY